jgi:2-oxoglutarate ferredoxin oxidoreductase subunit gamma
LYERVIIAGFGGQGIMLAGKLLSHAAMCEGKFVTWLPSYGAEVRGGTAYCMVTISARPIASPYVDRADVVITMNGPSAARFVSRVVPKGILITNGSLVAKRSAAKGIRVIRPRCSEIAADLGDVRAATMVALGAYCFLRKTVRLASVLAAAQAAFHDEAVRHINEKALRCGARGIR